MNNAKAVMERSTSIMTSGNPVVNKVRDSGTGWIVATFIWIVPFLIVALSGWLVTDIVMHGIGQMSWEFFTTDPRRSGRAGGIAPILVSTALVVLVATVVAAPLALGTAILLTDYVPASSPAARWIRRSLDILAGIPSIVFGLFGNVVFCNYFGLGFSLLSGGLTLACMALPIIMRAAEESLRDVPDGCRQGAVALGMPRHRAVLLVILPIASPGIIDGLFLGIGRSLAETAALVYTSGYVDRMPQSLYDSGRTLSVHIFDLSMNVTGGDARAYASSLGLIGILLVLSGLSSAASRLAQCRNRF
jgi:phosphate transport system permease protein